ncbi:MAG: NAD(P)-binding protein [Hydrogenimonas sp.]|nr:NAD(P)-binding protein [Hydrogenimonas sp.]
MDRKSVHIGVVGGGVAGVTAALLLGGIGFRVTLFEKGKTLIGGPPFCHLHAGGNLYREISDEQCLTLLRQSIEFAKLYPFCVDRRPTVIAVPLDDEGEPERLLKRLRLLRESYRDLVAKDESFRVLGEPDEYFRLYTKEDMELLAKKYSAQKPKNADEWMAPLARNLNLSKVKYPLILVQEYGLNLFRLSAGVELALQRMESVELLRDCMVTGVEDD